MSCFCAVIDISRCLRTSQATSSVSASLQAVRDAEFARIDRAEFGMVAAPALGDVVEQTGEQQQLRLAQARPHFVRDREALVLRARGETGDVAQHRQRVLVDGEDMEQVELHAPGHLRERRQPAPEHAEPRHARAAFRPPAGRAAAR